MIAPICRVIALLTVVFVTPSNAQTDEISLEMGPVFRMGGESVALDLVGFDTTGYYMWMVHGGGKYGKAGYSIVKIGPDLTPTEEALNIK